MDNKQKIVLPKDVQIKMMEFFIKTSVPRILKESKNN